MSDKEAKILELIQDLTSAQQLEALNHALAVIGAREERHPALPQTSD